ncbi:reverse transcriptase domain-containing protein [Tanacetum coccineum]
MYNDLYLGKKTLVERENVGFDLTKSDLCPSFVEELTIKDVGLCVADSLTDPIRARRVGLRARGEGTSPPSICDSTKAAKGRYDIDDINMAFQKMGNGHCGSLSEAPGKLKYLIVAIDYFTKWLGAKPLASITGRQVKNFAFDNIVCRFRIPATIITDNITQLINKSFKSWAKGLEIKVISMSVYHP